MLLRAAVEEVSEPSRAVLVAHYFDGRTLESVAVALGRPLETVRTQRRRGLAELRTALDRRHAGDRSLWAGLLLFVSGPPSDTARAAPRRLALGAAAALLVASAVYFAFGPGGGPSRPTAPDEIAAAVPDAQAAPETPALSEIGGDPRSNARAVAGEPPAPPPTSEPAPPAAPPPVDRRRLAVRVVAPDGLPVPDAVVSITASLDLPDLPPQRTDGQGRTTIEVDPAQLMRAPGFEPPASGVAIRAKAVGHAYSRTHYVPIAEDGSAFEIVLGGPEQIIDVHVIDAEGQPVVGALVEADKRRKGLGRGDDGVLSTDTAVGAYTGEDGQARLPHLALGEHELDVRAAGFLLRTDRVPTVEPRVAFEVRLDRGATLVGDVRRADGSAVADAAVFAPQPEFHRETPPGTRTDADGRFRLSGLQAGSARIFARGPRPDDGCADAILELEPQGETPMSITLHARSALSIRVQDVRAGDVAGIVVVLDARPDAGPAWRTIALVQAAGTCTIDAFPAEILDCTVLRGSDGHVYRQLAIDARLPQEFLIQVDVGAIAALDRCAAPCSTRAELRSSERMCTRSATMRSHRAAGSSTRRRAGTNRAWSPPGSRVGSSWRTPASRSSASRPWSRTRRSTSAPPSSDPRDACASPVLRWSPRARASSFGTGRPRERASSTAACATSSRMSASSICSRTSTSCASSTRPAVPGRTSHSA